MSRGNEGCPAPPAALTAAPSTAKATAEHKALRSLLYAAREGGKAKGEEEQDANQPTHAAHRRKNLRQADKGQARAAGHALAAEEHVHRRLLGQARKLYGKM